MNQQQTLYASFGQRFAAMLIDNIIFVFVLAPVALIFFEQPQYTEAEMRHIMQTQGLAGLIDHTQLFVQQGIILCITVIFWVRFAGTPGKRIMKIAVVDTTTHKPLTVQQSIIRYLGYFISAMPMGGGFFWMLLDEKKQTWHDKCAHSVVVRIESLPHNFEVDRKAHSDVHTLNKSNSTRDDDDVFTA